MYTPGATAEAASATKTLKYEPISATYLFVLLAVEILGPICKEGSSFLKKLSAVFLRSEAVRASLALCLCIYSPCTFIRYQQAWLL